MTSREGFAVARDGTPIYFHLWGEGSAPPLVLCDGIGCDGFVWKYVTREFEKERRLLHWNYRGHGKTPAPRDRRHLSVVDLADDFDAVLKTLEIESGVLLGHSMGVQVCLEIYRRHQQRVRGLGLLCGSYGNPLKTFQGQDLLELALPYLQLGARMAPRFVLGMIQKFIPTRLSWEIASRVEVNPQYIRPEDFMPYLDHIATLEPELFLEMLAYAGRHTAKEILPMIQVPTLVVAGERDGFTPRSLSDEMGAQIPGAELVVVPGGSHTAPLERPELVAEALRRLLDRAA